MRFKLTIGAGFVAALPLILGTMHTHWGIAWGLLLAPLFFALARRRARELLLACIAIVLCLEASDIALRVLGDDLVYYDAHGRFVESRPEAEDLYRYRPGASYLAEDHGDLTAAGGDPAGTERRRIRFETDAAGFRTPQREVAASLVILGDSFGAALGTSQEDAIAARLEAHWTTYNLSVGGAGPREQLLTLTLELPRLARTPDARLLWLIFEGNDLDESKYAELDLVVEPGTFRRVRTRWRSFRKRSPIRQLLERIIAGVGAHGGPSPVRAARLHDGRTLLYYAPYDHDRDLDAILHHRRYPEFADLFSIVLARAREAGLEVFVAILPTKARIYPTDSHGNARVADPDPEPTGFARAVGSLCQKHSVRCLDLYPGLVEEARTIWERERGMLWWRDDTHWNGHGHAAAARLISDALLAAPPEPAGP